jgi:hypothetical protein
MSTRKEMPWYQQVGLVIRDYGYPGPALDIAIREEGFRSIHELINYEIYSDLPERDRYRQAYVDVHKTQACLDKAIEWVKDTFGITVFRIMQEPKSGSGLGKSIRCLTTNPDYKNAAEQEVRRIGLKARAKVHKSRLQIKNMVQMGLFPDFEDNEISFPRRYDVESARLLGVIDRAMEKTEAPGRAESPETV